MKLQRLVVAGGLITFLVASAWQVAMASEWTSAVTPTAVQGSNTTGTSTGVLEVYVTTSQAVVNPAGCTATDAYVTIDPVIANATYAGLLSALASGASVQFYVSSTACAENRPMILSFEIN
jgi:hypothetical protein